VYAFVGQVHDLSALTDPSYRSDGSWTRPTELKSDPMAIELKPVDVVVVGLGAAGGAAVLPLARAGLKVAGLEAGTWMTKDPGKSFHADEIYNNVRGLVTSGSKVRGEIPTVRNGPNQPARRGATHPMMNAIGGTSIHYHAQSWRF